MTKPGEVCLGEKRQVEEKDIEKAQEAVRAGEARKRNEREKETRRSSWKISRT